METAVLSLLEKVPKFAVTVLITLAMLNLLLGVVLRYVVGGITEYFDLDPVPFTWVEEIGEMTLAWLTLIGAAIGIRQRAHFTLHAVTHLFSPRMLVWLDRMHHVVIAGFGLLAAVYAVNLCQLNWTLATPGLQISLAFLYASAVVGGLLIAVYAISMIIAPPPPDPNALH